MATITITHEPGEHTTLTGSQKHDGVLEIVRLHGRFIWRRYSGIHIPASRDKAPQMYRINTAKKALEEAGHTVILDIDDTVRPTAEREAARAERSAARVERLEERAGRTAAKADARRAGVDAIGDHIPMGQPILVGHHSERRARRDAARMDNHMRASIELGKESDLLASRAQGAAHLQEMRNNPRVTMRRVEKLKADRRTYERRVAEAGGADKAPNGTREVARLTEEIGYWEGLLAELAESGAFVAWGPEHFRKGDYANVRGRWCEVARINKKSVSVRNRFGWSSDSAQPATWDEISGRRRDDEQIDTPNGEAWPVELARKVARWADLVAAASRARRHTPRHGSDEERTAWNVGYAQRLVHGLQITAADAEVKAFAPPADDTETARLLAGASVDIFDRLQAGELVPDVLASITPLRPVEPAWTMPAGDPERLQVKELRKGDIVAGLYGTGGLFDGSVDRLSRYFCGPVARVIGYKGDDYSGERFVGYWTVVLEDGTSREFKPWHPVGAFTLATQATTEAEPAPVLKQDALNVVSDDPAMAAEVDARYTDDESKTVGARMDEIQALCVDVLQENGITVKGAPAPTPSDPGRSDFDAAAVQIERHRASVTQGEVSVSYRGKLLGRFGDNVQLCKSGSNGDDPHPHGDGASCFGGFHGRGDRYWIDAAAAIVAKRTAAELPAPASAETFGSWADAAAAFAVQG